MKNLLLITLLFATSCAQSQWVQMNTPLDGSRSGVIQFNDEEDHEHALHRATEFCAERKVAVTAITYGYVGQVSSAIGPVASSKPINMSFLHFVCLQGE